MGEGRRKEREKAVRGGELRGVGVGDVFQSYVGNLPNSGICYWQVNEFQLNSIQIFLSLSSIFHFLIYFLIFSGPGSKKGL